MKERVFFLLGLPDFNHCCIVVVLHVGGERQDAVIEAGGAGVAAQRFLEKLCAPLPLFGPGADPGLFVGEYMGGTFAAPALFAGDGIAIGDTQSLASWSDSRSGCVHQDEVWDTWHMHVYVGGPWW